MKIRILADGDEEALVDLQSWLARDPGTARLPVSASAGNGPTMGVLEALDVIIGNGVEIANFAVAYATWRSVKGGEQSPDDEAGGGQTLVHGDSTVDIGHLSPEELAGLLRRLNDDRPTGTDG
ncbi:effector-associated constant component EACC1 [Streptomyces sp. NPDC054787]